MTNETDAQRQEWNAAHVYILAGTCLVIGVVMGYLFKGSQSISVRNRAPQAAATATAPPTSKMPSLEDLKRMADTQAKPLTQKLNENPKNADAMKQLGKIYESTHQFKEAADYYGKALAIDPKDVPTRTELASCLYYSGDVDGALAQLEQALKIDPKDVNSQFNLGWIRLQSKKDAKGALAAWTQLLKTNPQLESAKKARVEQLIAEVQQHAAN
jgi:cytochrome c-type biogenesis protein CcmH/NrfG